MTDVTTIENDTQPLDPEPARAEPVDAVEAIRQARSLIPVGPHGAKPLDFAQQVDFAKTMTQAKNALPKHLRNNPGDCLAVIEIANKFNYPAYMVARQSYVVNDMLTFMGQFIMAVINDFCPLKHRLKHRFEGEGPTLRVIITGHFKGEVDPVEYESPTFAEIKVKNSPLWATDPRQQFVYFGCRRWQSRYWPEGLFGIYSPDEIEDHPELHVGADQAKDVTGLAARIAEAPKGGEGYTDGYADRELSQIAPAGQKIIDAEPARATADHAPAGDPAPAATTVAPKKERTTKARRANAPPAEEPAPEDPPRTTTLERGKAPTSKAVQRVADRAEATAATTAAKAKVDPVSCAKCGTVYANVPTRCEACGSAKFAPASAPPAKTALKSPADYIAYAKAWIETTTTHDAAMEQWDGESDLRNQIKVPIKERTQLQGRIDAKFGV